MRAVLCATFAARRRARPTAAESSLLFRKSYFRFNVIALAIEEYYCSYHTRSKHLLKAYKIVPPVASASGNHFIASAFFSSSIFSGLNPKI